jgi:hypothetical protein
MQVSKDWEDIVAFHPCTCIGENRFTERHQCLAFDCYTKILVTFLRWVCREWGTRAIVALAVAGGCVTLNSEQGGWNSGHCGFDGRRWILCVEDDNVGWWREAEERKTKFFFVYERIQNNLCRANLNQSDTYSGKSYILYTSTEEINHVYCIYRDKERSQRENTHTHTHTVQRKISHIHCT